MEKKKVKTTEVDIRDHYGNECLGDSISRNTVSERRPQGEVHVFEIDENGKKQLVKKSNLVVYNGREILAQMLVRTNNSSSGSAPDAKDHFLSWFGLGSGGVLPADPLDPVPPTLENTDLNSSVIINATDSTAADSGYKHPFDQIEFERDSLNNDKWLTLKITVTIGVDDANGSQISEAGLFSAVSDAGGWSGDFFLFARVTFSSIVKTADRRLVFVWYLYV
jgi:hypothetical protein